MKSMLYSRVKSFKYAFAGISFVIRTQKNMQIHLIIGALSSALFLKLGISIMEWITVIIVSGLVLITESLNTAIEYLGNAYSKEHNTEIGIAKDIGAGAVLISAVIAATTGIIIISNYI